MRHRLPTRGLDDRIEPIRIRGLPFLVRDLFAEHRLPARRASCCTAPARVWQDLIARRGQLVGKKVAEAPGSGAKSSSSHNGPDLLNSIGRDRRQIRLVFHAPVKSPRLPGYIFFDGMVRCPPGAPHQLDMDRPSFSLLTDRRVEGLRNVIVTALRTRDLIDPSILARPPRREDQDRVFRRVGRYPELRSVPTADCPCTVELDHTGRARRRMPMTSAVTK